MTILDNDTIEFKVTYKNDNGELQILRFDTFAGAAGACDALVNKTRYLDVRAYSEGSAWSAGLYKYDKTTNTRSVCNEYALKTVISEMNKRRMV